MEDEEDFLDLDFDTSCYTTTWSLIEMWYRRARQIKKREEKQTRKNQK